MGGDYVKCKHCHQYGWADSHRCPPQWTCRIEAWHGAEWSSKPIYAMDAQEAAEKFAELHNSDEPVVNQPIRVDVAEFSDEPESFKMFDVIAEPTLLYGANEVLRV